MLRRTNFGALVDDLGTGSEDEKALAELIKIAESVGMEVIENKTAISIKFCLEVMKRLVSNGTAERTHLLNHIENLEERIKQIEQEPCGDCINRKAAIKETLKHTMTSGVTNQGVWNECVQAIADTLANTEYLPSVKPKAKTGRWTLDGSDNSLECINCGCVIYANDIMRGEPHYCPNCGTKMESEG